MSMQYIRDTYGVPAKVGGRVTYTYPDVPRHGTITGSRNGKLRIRMDGQTQSLIYHPTWMLVYVDPTNPQGAPDA
jgi:hypothetical protein